MVDVYVNYLAVVVAAIANMALGFVWYGPLFGKMWMSLNGITKEKINSQKVKSGMWKAYTLAFLGSLAMAYVLSNVLTFSIFYTGSSGMSAGLSMGFWIWLGFIAPITLGSVLWEGKPWKLWFLVNGYYLLSALIMGSILALWM